MLTMFQGGVRPREPRTKVLVPCRLNVGGAWADACIHNVSSRGMLVVSDVSPGRGSYVEIRRGTLVMVGCVMWQEERCFGVRTQDRVSVDALVNEPRRRTAPACEGAPGERRAHDRLVAEGHRARQVEQNRHAAAAFQFVVLLAAITVAAVIAGQQVFGILGGSTARIGAALGGGPG